MTEQVDDFGVICAKWIPITWTPTGNARQPEQVAHLNEANTKRLRTLIERETREQPTAELSTLESLMVEVLRHLNPPGRCHTANLAAYNIEWFDNESQDAMTIGDVGQLTFCPDANLPYPITFNASVVECDEQSGQRHVIVKLMDRCDRVIDLYEQLVFIYYRRGVARRDQQQMSLS